MIKCVLIYLWIYIGLFYMIEAGDDDEHVHIKLHMTSGHRKRAQIQQHTHQHHKKRHASSPPHQHHRHHHHHQQHSQAPPLATTSTNVHHESPHHYLSDITTTSSSSSVPQNHVFQSTHTRTFPSSSPLNLHESGQLLNMEEDVFGQGDVGGESLVSVDTEAGEHMMIPSYLAKNFASFPKPTTTYETEIVPHNSEGYNVVSEGLDGLEDMEENNEITAPAGRDKGSLQSVLLTEHMENYHRYKPSSTSLSSSSSAKAIKNEQLLQQLLQQQHNDQPEIMNAPAYKSTKLRGNKYKAEKDYNSEDDMTEAMMYSSSVLGTRNNPVQSFNRPTEDVAHGGSIKALTVDDIWSQLQQQYLNRYTPQAQPLTSAADSDEQLLTTTSTKTKPKRKRNTKRQRQSNPTTTTSYFTSWPPRSYAGNNHHKKHHLQPIKQQQHFYDDTHSLPSASAFSSSSLSSSHNTDFFAKRPFNKQNTQHDEDDTDESDEETAAEFNEGGGDDDDFDVYGDESFEDAVYQRGKKFTGHTSYGQHSHVSKAFKNHDLFGSYATPVTATMATNIQPSTYHPNLVSSTLPSFTSSTTNAFLPTLSHPSTSYQWHTQQNYPASYQTYHLQYPQQQSPQWPADEQYAQQQSNALRIQTPNIITSSKLSPTQSNEFTVSASTSTSTKSSDQPPSRYKKRKNRIKPKRNRIVVL